MDDPELNWLHPAVGAGSLGVVCLLSAPATRQIWSRTAYARRSRSAAAAEEEEEAVPPLFETADGRATAASMAAFSDRRPRRAAAASLALGLAASVAAALLLTLRHVGPATQAQVLPPLPPLPRPPARAARLLDAWADVPAWALVCAQRASMPAHGQYDRRFQLAGCGALSSLVLLVSLGARYGADVVHVFLGGLLGGGTGRGPTAAVSAETAVAVAAALEMVAALTAAAALASVPHRPDVYDKKGQLVDQQHAASLLTRATFSWNSIVFETAQKNTKKPTTHGAAAVAGGGQPLRNDNNDNNDDGDSNGAADADIVHGLTLDDLPQLDGDTRAACVTARYVAGGGSAGGPRGRLWWQLVRAYWRPLGLQWALTFVRSVLALFPQYVLYQFLEGIERRHRAAAGSGGSGGDSGIADPQLWGWVVAIGASQILSVWVSSAQRWLTSSRLEAPLNSLVQSLIFQKALRLDEAADPGHRTVGGSGGDDDAKDSKKETGSKGAGKPATGGDIRQSVVNHMKLDSGRMMIFCTYNYWIPLALFKLVLVGAALIQLLGWRAFFAGLVCGTLAYPISHIMSGKYAAIQFGLMKYRDGKAHVLTEALQGMRQIKYSALEPLYEAKILEARNAELKQFWRVVKWMCGLSLVINIGPLFLSCVSLAVYTVTTPTRVRASVIFASLGLFDQLDEAIGYLPLIQVYLVEAWTSCVRVETYLNQPEKAPVATPGDGIVLDNATVRWPRVADFEGSTSSMTGGTTGVTTGATTGATSNTAGGTTGSTGNTTGNTTGATTGSMTGGMTGATTGTTGGTAGATSNTTGDTAGGTTGTTGGTTGATSNTTGTTGGTTGATSNTTGDDETRSILRNVSVAFPSGELSLITGKTGAGKSLLLAALLGEVKLLSGRVQMPSPAAAAAAAAADTDMLNDSNWIVPAATAFVSQTPWVESGTLRSNILFGLPFRAARYRAVLRAAALEADLALLVDGDETEVGPKGVTLSGGQRWRVALARALYSRAGILVLDDVLSAVDAHVGRTIVDRALAGCGGDGDINLARGRTRILATHHPEMCLRHAAYLVRLDAGRVVSAEAVTPSSRPADETAVAAPSLSLAEAASEGASTAAAESDGDEDGPKQTRKKKKTKADDEEGRETGRVKSRIYREYLKASQSTYLWAVILACMVLARVLGVATTWSLKKLSESYPPDDDAPLGGAHHTHFFVSQATAGTPAVWATAWAWPSAGSRAVSLAQPFFGSGVGPGIGSGVIGSVNGSSSGDADTDARRAAVFWIAMYVVFEFTALFVGVLDHLLFLFAGLRASRRLFERMTHAVLRAPLRWVDTVPTGRILNRCTSDTFVVDRRLPSDLSVFIQSVLGLVVIIAANVSVSPLILVFGLGLLVLYARIASVYMVTAREAKRINSVAHSPVYDQFSSVLSGLSTIRAFGRTDFYMDRMCDLIDNAAKASWALQLLARWMNFRMGMFGAVFVTAVAACVVFSGVDAALAGFGLVFALRYTSALARLLSNITSIELGFNAAERMIEYTEIETEPEGGRDAPAAWPSRGHIEVDGVTVRYAADLPPVLRDLTFSVQPGERIGVVGRTGAGKSTLAAVLFRLLEPVQGAVRIDGLDIATLKLGQLRSRLAIIPQDPFLFSGTLRSNLDLDGSMDDADLLQALRRVHLVDEEVVAAAGVAAGAAAVAAASAQSNDVGGAPSATGHVENHTEEEAVRLLAATDAAEVSEAVEEGEEGGEETDRAAAAAADVAAAAVVSDAAADGSQPADDGGAADRFGDLGMAISTGGGNLSQGQRQLVCLARALLTRPKIVVLDEATSAVDRGTDGIIQESLRQGFAETGCTVLVIAHRLSTVVDFDRLLVLEAGRVAEMGTPRELMERGMAKETARREAGGVEEQEQRQEEDGTGAFWELVKKSAEKDKLLEMVFGESHGGQ